MIVSFYIREHSRNFSSVKFGSYDESGVNPLGKLEMFQTKNIKEWVLNSKDFQVNGGEVIGGDKELAISFHLPYMYLPEVEYNAYLTEMD